MASGSSFHLFDVHSINRGLEPLLVFAHAGHTQGVATNRLPAASRKRHDNSTINLEIGARRPADCGSTLTLQKEMNRLLAITILVLLAGCQYNPFAHRFLTREPSKNEVVGQYSLTEVYVDMVDSGLSERIRAASTTPTITLHPNGTAILSGFPFFEEQENSFDYKFTGFEDLTASWEISSVGGVSSGGDDYKTVYGLRLIFPDGRLLFDSPSLTGDKTVDGLIFTLYDGDQGQILGYKKTNAER
ncbi:MAG: hypothetical protein KDN22_07345 [Verrucomicrobiae bacterium]|nr:hypothetical protein [Verrucomicrobiae bacterium]